MKTTSACFYMHEQWKHYRVCMRAYPRLNVCRWWRPTSLHTGLVMMQVVVVVMVVVVAAAAGN